MVYRIACTFLDDHVKKSCTLILKIAKADSKRNQIDHYYYWKREALVYRSGILEQLPPFIKAPKCYAVDENADGTVWIWLEDLDIEPLRGDWNFKQMNTIAYLLGKFNGSYIEHTDLKNHLFLCRSWQRSWVKVCSTYAGPIQEQKVQWERYFNDNTAIWEQYCRNRARVSSLLDALEDLPRVFAHQDVHWDNIFLDRRNGCDSLIAMDWQFASVSGVGEELGRIFGYALLKKKIPIDKAEEYKEELFLHYLQGLINVGWSGDAKLARFGFTASSAFRFIMVFDKLLRNFESSPVEQSNYLLSVGESLLEMAEESWALRRETTLS